MDRVVRSALYGIAGELQVLAYEAEMDRLYESDLRAATRRNLQIHIANKVIAEASVKPKTWHGLGTVDIAIRSAAGTSYEALLELKLWKSLAKIDESLWDGWKLASAYKEGLAPHVYLVAAGPRSYWGTDHAMHVFWKEGKLAARASWTIHQKKWMQWVTEKTGPLELPAGIKVSPICVVPIHLSRGEDWQLGCSKISTTPGPPFACHS